MKKINEMTDQELVKAIETLKDVEEMKTVVEQLKAEQDVRKKAAEAKRAEEEAKRKETEEKQRAEDAKKEQDLVEKQKSILGKYYKQTIYDTDYKYPTVEYTHFYKVIGVYENMVIVSDVKVRNNYISRSISYLNLDDIVNKDNKYYKPITREEYEAEYDKAMNGFTSLADMINNLHSWLF